MGPAVRRQVSRAWHGLAETLIGRDQAPTRARRSDAERRTAYAGITLATLGLCVISVATMHSAPGSHQLLSMSVLPRGLAGSQWLADLVAVAVVAPLPLAARYPLLAWRIAWLGMLLAPEVAARWWGGWPWGPAQVLAALVAFFLAGLHHRRAVLWWMWGLTLIPWCLWLREDVPNFHGPAGATVVFTAITIAVDSIRTRLQAQRALTAQAERIEAERARRAVLEERARIARELHDVVAHHMSLIAVQAETAPFRLADLPDSARAEFRALSGVAREALADMRRLLGVLRQDQPAELGPQPQLTDLPVLVDAARRAGVSVELSAPAELTQVPSGVGLCAYRIVQESLSNASQHAPGAAVTVSVGRDCGAVVLRVSNGPSGPARPGADQPGDTDRRGSDERRAGHGLVGMRERVSLLGGSLSAGPAPDGGFVVSAVLPLRETA
jgi:signal transduction histidine kinase